MSDKNVPVMQVIVNLFIKLYRPVLFIWVLFLLVWQGIRSAYAFQIKLVAPSDLYFYGALAILLLTGITMICLIFRAWHSLKLATIKTSVGLAWITFFLVIISVLIQFDGYIMAAIGFNAIINDLDFTANKVITVLLSNYEFHPMRPLYLFASMMADINPKDEFISSIVWEKNAITILLVANTLMALIMLFKAQGIKLIVAFILLTTVSTLGYHVATLDKHLDSILFFNQLLGEMQSVVLLIVLYSIFRQYAFLANKSDATPDSTNSQIKKTMPSGIFVFLSYLLIAPTIADVFSQYSLASEAKNITTKLNAEKRMAKKIVSAINLNVRSGPSSSQPSVGKIHIGDEVLVHGLENGWVKIAEGRWSYGKYLLDPKVFNYLSNQHITVYEDNHYSHALISLGFFQNKYLGRFRLSDSRQWRALRENKVDSNLINFAEYNAAGKRVAYLELKSNCNEALNSGNVRRIFTNCQVHVSRIAINATEKLAKKQSNRITTRTSSKSRYFNKKQDIFDSNKMQSRCSNGMIEQDLWDLALRKNTRRSYREYINVCNPASNTAEAIKRMKKL